MKSMENHWNAIFSKTDDEKLGWYEKDFSATLALLRLIPEDELKHVFIPGVGTSSLVEMLLNRGLRLTLNDISTQALEKIKERTVAQRQRIRYLCHDIARPLPAETGSADLWLDRAVLHFLPAGEMVEGYFANVDRIVRPGGYVLLAQFSKNGAARCAGLDVRRYALGDFEKYLPAYKVLASREHTYYNPSGEARPYIYALFRKGRLL